MIWLDPERSRSYVIMALDPELSLLGYRGVELRLQIFLAIRTLFSCGGVLGELCVVVVMVVGISGFVLLWIE